MFGLQTQSLMGGLHKGLLYWGSYWDLGTVDQCHLPRGRAPMTCKSPFFSQCS